jgi:hypothetical protein
MPDSSHPGRLARPRHARLLATALASATLIAACGGSSHTPPVATVNSTTATTTPDASTTATTTTSRSSSTTANDTASSSPPTQAVLEADELAYSRCMRANGVPNFPDPGPDGGVELPAGVNGASPVFKAAQAKCGRILPGLGGPGSGPAPSAAALAHWVAVAECMRRNGVPDFPDPQTKIPSHPFPGAGAGVISDRDGVILVFPHSIDMQSPLFIRAAARCGFQLTNH